MQYPVSHSFTIAKREAGTYLCLCFGFFEQIMYTYLPPFLLTLLQPSHSFLTELRTFIPRTWCVLIIFVAGLTGLTLSFWRADVSDWVCVPHVSDEHDRANVGKDARILIEGAAKEQRRRSARAAGVESMAVDCDCRASRDCVSPMYSERVYSCSYDRARWGCEWYRAGPRLNQKFRRKSHPTPQSPMLRLSHAHSHSADITLRQISRHMT
jgi:hypothetical protein